MYTALRPLLFAVGPETAHSLSALAARAAQRVTPFLLDRMFEYAHPSLSQDLLGLTFTNPIGLAAGFDKNARLVPFFRHAGAGFVEIGSVTARKSRGNPRPRLFRLPEDEALINRMGLGNHGVKRIAPRVKRQAGRRTWPLGVNIAKTHDPNIMGADALDDFVQSFRLLAPVADYITLNVSCPNTAEGKTFEDPNAFDDLLTAIMHAATDLKRRPPILVKFSPPDSEKFVLDSLFDELVLVAQAHGVDGFVATNTAPDRDGLTVDPARLDQIGKGGLSGAPIARRSDGLVRYLYRKTGGRTPIIGVGGVDSPESAYRKIKAGASLVQIYTGLVYHGPGLFRSVKEGLVRLLEEDGHSSIKHAVGLEA